MSGGNLGGLIPSNLLCIKWEAFPVHFHTFITMKYTKERESKSLKWRKHDFKNYRWSLKSLEAPQFPSDAPKDSFFHILINTDDKKGNHSISRCWPHPAPGLFRRCGEKLRFGNQCGIHKHKEGIWGVLPGRGVGKGKGWPDKGPRGCWCYAILHGFSLCLGRTPPGLSLTPSAAAQWGLQIPTYSHPLHSSISSPYHFPAHSQYLFMWWFLPARPQSGGKCHRDKDLVSSSCLAHRVTNGPHWVYAGST